MGISLEVQLLGHWPVCMAFQEIGDLFSQVFSKVEVSFDISAAFSASSPLSGDAIFPSIARKSFVGMRTGLTVQDGMILFAFLSYRIAPKIKGDENV